MFQRTPPWVLPHRDRPISRLERLLYRRFPPAPEAGPARSSTWLREPLVLGLVHRPRPARWARAAGAQAPRRPGRRPGAAATPAAQLPDRLQADPAVQRLVSGADQAQRGGRHRTASPRSARTASSTPTGGCTRSTRSSSAPDSTSSTPDRAPDSRPRRQVLSEAWERGMRGLLRGGRRRLSELLLDRRAEHRPRPQLDGLHDRVAAQLRARLPADDGGPRRRQRRGAARGAVGLQRGAAPAARGHGVERGRLCQLVHRRPGAKPQHLAAADLDLPAPDPPLRRRELPARGGGERVQWRRRSISRAAPGADRSSAAPLASR